MTAVSAQPRPAGAAVMRQEWKHLLFLHWEWDPGVIQATLPMGLTVDTFRNSAWLGVVPFFMRRVRPALLPALPWISDFLELNVRTYVKDASGRPGVWFYSLDCNQPVAVKLARTFFHLPYNHASMRADVRDSKVIFRSRRGGVDAHFAYPCASGTTPADQGSLEEFLLERYRLYAAGARGLYTGKVWHAPYLFAPVVPDTFSTVPLRSAGFLAPDKGPCHAVYAPGVDVRVFPLQKVEVPAL